MKEFVILEKVTIARTIIVKGDSVEEIQENYDDGVYDEQLESCYFNGNYDKVTCQIKEVN